MNIDDWHTLGWFAVAVIATIVLASLILTILKMADRSRWGMIYKEIPRHFDETSSEFCCTIDHPCDGHRELAEIISENQTKNGDTE